jgi:asparagine synthase (glutamine-hydrolysing)
MCGICGIIKFNNLAPQAEKLQKMMEVMKHRGPDDEGKYFNTNVGLGFVRLSIIDLSPLGHQPMFSHEITKNGKASDSGRYVIIYNGEVYNYIELREELRSIGYEFKSNTDTEVVLNSYIEWGEKCLDKFNGMWAFAIYDKELRELFCARDRFGIKPFYYYKDNEQFIFASEIPPILSVLEKQPTANNHAIFDFLVFNRTDQTEQTFFNEVKKLQHGHTLRIQKSQIKIQKWYNLRKRVSKATGFKSSKEYRELLSDAIKLRLRSDVPVGVCLSGGLDSSSIVSVLLKDCNKKDLNTFSAVYEKGQIGDESDFINTYSSQLSNMFYTTPSAESLYNDLMMFVKAQGEPIPSTSPYAQFKVMKLAKDNVVVTLDGQGADEALAGYDYFFGFYFKDLLKKLRWIKLFSEMLYYFKIQKSVFGIKTFIYFLLPKNIRTKLRQSEKGYLTSYMKKYNSHSVIADELYGSFSLQDSRLNHFEYKLEHLLKWEDRNSMHFSLEARVPFLDYRLVEETLATTGDNFIYQGMTKNILRSAMVNTLPEKIRTRIDKIGFQTPQDEWFRTEKFKKFIFDLLNSDSFKERNLIDVKKAKLLYNKHLNKKINISNEIWKWVHLELWFRNFIDEVKVELS